MEQLSPGTETTEAQALEPVLWNKRSHCSEKPMLRKAHTATKTEHRLYIYIYECGCLLPRGTGPFGYAFHSIPCHRLQERDSNSNCWSSEPYEQFPPTGLFSFHNRDMVEKAKCSQSNTQRAEMKVLALSTQRPPEGRWVFAGQAGHGGPQGLQVPRTTQGALCGQKDTGGEMVVDSPIYGQPERWRREWMPPTPEIHGWKSVLTFYWTFKTKWAPPWKLQCLGMERTVQKEMSGLGSVLLYRLI